MADFSGVWKRDLSRSPASAFGFSVWKIRQTNRDLVLDAGGQTFVFTFGRAERVYIDESLGDLPNFVRKIRTKAVWDGSVFRTERTSFAEQRNPQTGEITTPAGAITLIDAIQIPPMAAL